MHLLYVFYVICLLAEQINNAIFPITVHPVAETLFDLEREIRIIIERADGIRLKREYTEVVKCDHPIQKNLSITNADHVTKDSQIVVLVLDAQTGEELDRKTALFHVDVDF